MPDCLPETNAARFDGNMLINFSPFSWKILVVGQMLIPELINTCTWQPLVSPAFLPTITFRYGMNRILQPISPVELDT